jgi:hypothetical protein
MTKTVRVVSIVGSDFMRSCSTLETKIQQKLNEGYVLNGNVSHQVFMTQHFGQNHYMIQLMTKET